MQTEIGLSWLKQSRLLCVLALLATLSFLPCRSACAADPGLQFSRDGKFKIVQFTDTHFADRNEDLDEAKAAEVRARLIADMNAILELEKPDLVVFTGDNVLTPKLEYWRKLVDPMVKKGIPWAAVMGNHDHEKTGKTGSELISLVRSLPGSLAQHGPDELGGGGNYILLVKSATTQQAKAAIYLMDSGEYAPNESLGHYAWFTFSQVAWFRQQSRTLTEANGNVPLPSIAFFHIPVPEYDEALAGGKVFGTKGEAICSPKVNSGFFCAALESKSLMGCFVGHDHNNDTAATCRGICLAYGRKTGEFAYRNLPSGARVIELYEGKSQFATWTRDGSGKQENRANWPDDFRVPEKKK